jgi:ribonuclease P protein component
MPKRHRANELRKLGLYIGVQASTKLHKSAVKRNRMRRRCREALRIAAMDFQGLDGELILRPRSSSLECAFEEL